LAGLLNSPDSTGNSIYQDGKLLLKYCITGPSKSEISAVKAKYEQLLQTGQEVTYYGNNTDYKDSNSLLIHWKLDDGNYRVIFGDLHEKTVSPEELIKLQSRMLQNEVEK
jgi:hypothetical protein